MLEEKQPVDLTPEQALRQGMSVREYAALEHGRLHNGRIRELRALIAAKEGAQFPSAELPLTRGDLATVLSAIAINLGAYSHNTQGQVFSEAARAGLDALKRL